MQANRKQFVNSRLSRFGSIGAAVAVMVALAVLTGCQGLSTGKTAAQSPQELTGGLTAAPASVTFGNVTIGTSQTQVGTLTNSGSSTINITQAAVTGAGFSITGLSLPLALEPGQSATFNVVFNPQSTGSVTGNLAFANDGPTSPMNVGLSGTAVAAGSLAANPTSFSFGSVSVGGSQAATETLTNTGGVNLTVTAAVASGAGFSYTGLNLPLTLAPNQSTTFGVVFAPTVAGASNGTLSISSSDSSTTLDLALSGNGVAVVPALLAPSPASITFTSVVVGHSQSQTETVTNSGGTSATISQIAASGTGFSVSGVRTPITLTPGQSTSFSVNFAPESAGSFSGSVAITSNASNPNLTIGLSGSATALSQGQLSVNPTTINVGSVTVGTSGTQTGTLSATGASVVVSSVNVGGSEFVVSGLAFPITIPAGQSATFTVTFTPQTSGVASVSASFVSNTANSPTIATLTGTGIAAPVHEVNLSWNADSSPNVVGYNIYRSSNGANGNYVKINGGLDANTAYTDSSVTDDQTYYYETTAVNSSNQESARSTAVAAVIPPP
jgi:hypothetical protein